MDVFKHIGMGYVIKVDGVDRFITYNDYGKDDGTVWVLNIKSEYADKLPKPIETQTTYASAERRYKKSQLDAIAVAKEGDYYPILKNAPLEVQPHSVSINWGKCQFGTACADFGCNTQNEILNVESDGFSLRGSITDTSTGTTADYRLQLED